jgi:hypothetical protein
MVYSRAVPFRKRPKSAEPALSDRRLLMQVREEPAIDAAEPIVLEEDLDIELPVRRLDDGRNAVFAFTTEAELLAWDPRGGPFVQVKGRVACRLVYQGGFDLFVVDPASNPTELDRAAMAALLEK